MKVCMCNQRPGIIVAAIPGVKVSIVVLIKECCPLPSFMDVHVETPPNLWRSQITRTKEAVVLLMITPKAVPLLLALRNQPK